MAFQIRRKGGGTLWAGGSLLRPDGRTTLLGPRDVHPVATWKNGATGAIYPVMQDVGIRVDGRVTTHRLTPMFAAQELDARRSGLPVYWEGAVRTSGGHGYLELTGYDKALSGGSPSPCWQAACSSRLQSCSRRSRTTGLG